MAAQKLRSISSLDDARSDRPARHPALTVVPFDPLRQSPLEDRWAQTLAAVAQHRDREAFARLFTHFAPRVKRYLMLAGSNESQAEELTQETFAIVWRKAGLFDPARAGVTTWLFTIARNLGVDLHRKRANRDVVEHDFDFDSMEAEQPPLDVQLDATRLEQRLGVALAQLSPDQLAVIRMAYAGDESQSQIAATLGLPLGTVKSRVRAALALLRRLLED